MPMSLNLNPAYVASHWEAVEDRRGQGRAARPTAATGAWCARCSSPTPTTRRWRLSVGCMHGPHDARVLPAAARQLRLPRVPEARSRRPRLATSRRSTAPGTTGWSARPTRSPRRSSEIYDEVGGFGQSAGVRLRLRRQPEAWQHSIELLAKEVLPKVQKLKPGPARLAAENPPPHQRTELRGLRRTGPTPRSARARPRMMPPLPGPGRSRPRLRGPRTIPCRRHR